MSFILLVLCSSFIYFKVILYCFVNGLIVRYFYYMQMSQTSYCGVLFSVRIFIQLYNS